ncbi:MAG TPA: hypothetical protein PKC29_01725 [Thermodesulfobacteriota bacterium]|nr:hypothetical protein [Thermodesulfobacteriota bacterium]
MIIHHPEISSKDGKLTVSAGIEFDPTVPGMPERLWFEFPEDCGDLVTDRADAFLSTMLLVAMRRGEKVIEVRGKVSPRFLIGINEYQTAFCIWPVWRFEPVRIECESLVPAGAENGPDIVMSAFSGGLDSFFTLKSFLPGNGLPESVQISHLLFVHGFDIKLEDTESFTLLRDAYSTMCGRLGIKLITCRTNCRQFGMERNWGLFHGSALIGAAHAAGRRAAMFHVPSSHSFTSLMPWGSDPGIDYLLSTEATQVLHHGSGYTRTEKTEAIAHWEEIRDKLRVCAFGDGTRINCCKCEKCLRTMMTLDMIGVLERYSAFPGPLTAGLVRNCRYWNRSDFSFAHEIMGYARQKKRWDIVANLSYAYVRSRILQTLRFARIKLSDAIKRTRAS